MQLRKFCHSFCVYIPNWQEIRIQLCSGGVIAEGLRKHKLLYYFRSFQQDLLIFVIPRLSWWQIEYIAGTDWQQVGSFRKKTQVNSWNIYLDIIHIRIYGGREGVNWILFKEGRIYYIWCKDTSGGKVFLLLNPTNEKLGSVVNHVSSFWYNKLCLIIHPNAPQNLRLQNTSLIHCPTL